MSQRLVPRALPPGSWLGVVGGGQLGRMFCQAAQRLGYRVCVLDPDGNGPAATIADRHIGADYDDEQALDLLAEAVASVTTEFENVPAPSLERLARHVPVSPAHGSVAIAQDRIVEKRFIEGCGVPVAPHAVIESAEDAARARDALFPGILKSARLGYDGKGQTRVADRAAACAAFEAMGGAPCVLEKRVDLAFEISVVLGRDFAGEIAVYPVAENAHRDGILAQTIVPARILPALAERARDAAITIARGLDYVGVLCVEFFVLRDGSLIVNEMAPRPHNSGHFTIDACLCSQFEQQARIMAGLPLGHTDQHAPAVMLNLLGDAWLPAGPAQPVEPDWPRLLAQPGVALHLYGKRQARSARKMGHVTVLGRTLGDALAVARGIDEHLSGAVAGADSDVAAAASRLVHGGLVAFATETVYGLGADASSQSAVAAIYRVKGRPADHPAIVHVVDAAAARNWGQWSPRVERLAQAFWPGPLTLIVERQEGAPAWASAGQSTIGLRCPAHPLAQALLREFARLGGRGIVAPSANRFGRVSPTRAEHVQADLADAIAAGEVVVLDGGACAVGVESTIVDLSREPAVLLRPGGIDLLALEAALGEPIEISGNVIDPSVVDHAAPRVSGSLASHYAPRTPLEVVDADRLLERLERHRRDGRRAVVWAPAASPALASDLHRHTVLLAPDDPVQYGHDLYATLRQLDLSGADQIVLQAPSRDLAWQAVWDRLLRASASAEQTLLR